MACGSLGIRAGVWRDVSSAMRGMLITILYGAAHEIFAFQPPDPFTHG